MWVITFEMKFGILWSQFMAMIALICLLCIFVLCYVWSSCVLFLSFCVVVGAVAPPLAMKTL